MPHGNSILAPGNFFEEITGSPLIGHPPLILPEGVNTDQYKNQSVGNLNPEFTANPNLPLINALTVKNAAKYIQFNIDSRHGGHPVTNIGFEQQHAKVTRYFATNWLEDVGAGGYTQLQYSQTIIMDIPIAGVGIVSFPHITTNTLTKKV